MANEKRLIDAWRLVIDLAKLQKHGEYDHENVLAVIASQEIVDAVEVPCKIGQTVYVINGLWVSHYVVTHFWYDGCFFKFKAINEEYAYECRDFSFFDERIGKTVFFTYEQAESALKKMYGGNEQ